MKVLIKLILFGLLITWNANAVLSPKDSILNIVNSMPQDSCRLQKIEECRSWFIDTPNELALLDMLLKEAQLQENIKYQSSAYRNRIRHYSNAFDKENTLSVSDSAISFFRKHKLYQSLFESESMIINMYTWSHEYEFALLKGYEMYEEAKSLNSQDGIVAACYALGYACYASGRYQEAIDWYKQGLRLVKGLDNTATELIDFNLMLTECYLSLKKADDVRTHIDSVQQHLLNYEKTISPKGLNHHLFYWLWIHARKVTVYLGQNELEQAKKQLDLAQQYTSSNIYNIYEDILYFAYSDYYLATGNYDKALDALQKGTQIQKEQHQESDPTIFRKRAQIYHKMRKYELAADEMQQSVRVADSLNHQRFSKQSSQLGAIYEINKLEAEGKKQEQAIHMQTLLLISLCLLTLLLAFFFLRYRQMKQQIFYAAQLAKHTEQSTAGFLTNMSREIRAFLGEIAHLSDLLIQESRQKERKEYAVRLQKRNEMAQLVIFDILDISKIESNRMKFQYEMINLDGLMGEIYSSSQQYLSPGIKLILIPGSDRSFITDAVHLSHILKNLIYYTIIHTGSGEVSLGYIPEQKAIRFYILGSGWATSEEERRIMFDRIAQTSGKLQDINLKMIICKGLISKMGGAIQVISDPTQSTRFEFTLPIHQNTDIN